MIALQQLEEMFANMRAETTWNVEGRLLWGYFFVDDNPEKLEQFAVQLVEHGYQLVRIYQTDNREAFVLHIQREEAHTPQTLHARNAEFEKLAREFELHSYDGMDVGPVPVREPGAEHRN